MRIVISTSGTGDTILKRRYTKGNYQIIKLTKIILSILGVNLVQVSIIQWVAFFRQKKGNCYVELTKSCHLRATRIRNLPPRRVSEHTARFCLSLRWDERYDGKFFFSFWHIVWCSAGGANLASPQVSDGIAEIDYLSFGGHCNRLRCLAQ